MLEHEEQERVSMFPSHVQKKILNETLGTGVDGLVAVLFQISGEQAADCIISSCTMARPEMSQIWQDATWL